MKRYLKIILIVIIVAAVIGGMAFVGYSVYKLKNKTYTSYNIKKTTENKNGSNSRILIGSKSVVKITRDGASAYDETGNEIWNVSYEMSDPVGDVCGDYAAIADVGAVTCYIVAKNGKLTKITVEHSIALVKTSNLGTTAVWMSDNGKDYISVYDASGKKAVDMMTSGIENGVPVAIGMSYDGSRLATSYAYYEDSKMKNQITFYNFGEMGSNYVDRLVGLKKYDDRLIGDIKFVGNERIVAFSDQGATVFDMEEHAEEIKEIKISEQIEAVSADNDHFAIMTFDGQAYKANVYDNGGKQVLTKQIDRDYSHFYINGKELLMYDSTYLYVLRLKGTDKVKVDFGMDLLGVVPCVIEKDYMLVGENTVEVIEITEEKKAED